MAGKKKTEPNALPQMTDFPSQRKGSKGGYVTLIQANLINRGYDVGPEGIDGQFGPKTEKALKEFQKDANMPPNGIVGPKMWEVLQKSDFRKNDGWKDRIGKLPEIPSTAVPEQSDSSSYKVIVEGLTRYQADLLVKLLQGNTVCRVIMPIR